jgi:hypothetical protein
MPSQKNLGESRRRNENGPPIHGRAVSSSFGARLNPPLVLNLRFDQRRDYSGRGGRAKAGRALEFGVDVSRLPLLDLPVTSVTAALRVTATILVDHIPKAPGGKPNKIRNTPTGQTEPAARGDSVA